MTQNAICCGDDDDDDAFAFVDAEAGRGFQF